MEIQTDKNDTISSTSTMEKAEAKDASESPKSSTPDSGTSRPSSPPPNCAICLGQCKNKSYSDSCLHQFCFKCLVQWSKVKAECPLCKQIFKSIIHNVKSNNHYDEYLVEPPAPPVADILDVDYFAIPRFRYRTTVTLHGSEGLALQRLLLRLPVAHPPVGVPSQPPYPSTAGRSRRSSRGSSFRLSVYRHNLWANPLPDVTGRHRECSPHFYRENPAQFHRLLPWLQRELRFLNDNHERIIESIVNLLPVSSILSSDFRQMLLPYLGHHTDHFLHEFYSFASSPYDMIGYDRNVQYVSESNRPPPSHINEISSTDSDSSDSDIMLVSPSATSPGQNYLVSEPSTSNGLNSLSNSVIAIETMSHSDTEDSSDEVVMVGYIKPPHERTPEVVDLASDSDAMVIEDDSICSPIEITDDLPSNTASSTLIGPSSSTSSSFSHAIETPSTSGLVKIKLKRNDNETLQGVLPGSDSDEHGNEASLVQRKNKRTKKKHKKCRFSSRYSASTEDTDRDTDTDLDFNKITSKVQLYSDDSEDCDSDYSDNKTKRLCKRKQTLASNILKKFKMSSTSQPEREKSPCLERIAQVPPVESNPIVISSSIENTPTTSKKVTQKKLKCVKHSVKGPSTSALVSNGRKLKIKSKSKTKEWSINKIFENQQVSNNTAKFVDNSKAKAINKLFNKSVNKYLNTDTPSTSKESNCENFNSDNGCDSDETTHSPQSPDNLLDLVSKSILKPNNSLLSINEHSQSSGIINAIQVPTDVEHLFDEIKETVLSSNLQEQVLFTKK